MARYRLRTPRSNPLVQHDLYLPAVAEHKLKARAWGIASLNEYRSLRPTGALGESDIQCFHLQSGRVYPPALLSALDGHA